MITPKPVLLAGVSPSGPVITAPFIEMNSDAESPDQIGLLVASFQYAFNGDFWQRIESAPATADDLSPTINGNVLNISQLFGLNPVTGNFDRVQVQPNNADALVAEDTGNLASLAFSYGYNGATFDRLRSAGSNADTLAVEATGQQTIIAQEFGFNGTSFDRVRIANIFHTVVATAAGSTAVWTPTAGKRFRLMGYTISVAGTLAATGVQALKLEDAATVIKNHFANVIETPSASVSGGDTQIGADLGQGQLSAAINNVLNINLGTAMATGGVAVNVWGTEE